MDSRSHVVHYGPGIDNILSMTVYGGTTSTYYYVKDHLGSVQAIVDASGTVVESYQYDAWGNTSVFDGSGNPLQASAIGNRFAWQGREISWATRLYYFRARWYDPVTGRWLSNDPIGISGGLNQYVFCGDNPVNFRDPLGLCGDGEKFVQDYTNRLMEDPYSLQHVLDMLSDPEIDIGQTYRDRIYQYKGRNWTSSEMGNIAAGYATTYAWGQSPVPTAMVGAELAGVRENWQRNRSVQKLTRDNRGHVFTYNKWVDA